MKNPAALGQVDKAGFVLGALMFFVVAVCLFFGDVLRLKTQKVKKTQIIRTGFAFPNDCDCIFANCGDVMDPLISICSGFRLPKDFGWIHSG